MLPRHHTVRALAAAVIAAAMIDVAAAPSFRSARFVDGEVPGIPPMAVGGGEVMLELAISRTGAISSILPLRVTPPYADLLQAAVRTWRFAPATQDLALPGGRISLNTPVDSTVLVAGIFRAPTLYEPTLGNSV